MLETDLEHSFESLKERPGNGLAVVELSDATYLQLFTVFSLLGLIGKAGVPSMKVKILPEYTDAEI